MHDLARYALICQDEGLVPIVEPDISLQGTHTLEQAVQINIKVKAGASREAMGSAPTPTSFLTLASACRCPGSGRAVQGNDRPRRVYGGQVRYQNCSKCSKKLSFPHLSSSLLTHFSVPSSLTSSTQAATAPSPTPWRRSGRPTSGCSGTSFPWPCRGPTSFRVGRASRTALRGSVQ